MPPAAIDPTRTALLVVDVQRGFEEIEARGSERNNPDAIAAIERLLACARTVGMRVIHVRHASTEAGSPFRPDHPGFAVMEGARELPGETVVVKIVNAAFIGTDLEERLRTAGVTTLAICGATTNQCVETTTRMAGNLGFDTLLVQDACWAYDRTTPDGTRFRAAQVHAMSLANLHDEFAEIIDAQAFIERVARAGRAAP